LLQALFLHYTSPVNCFVIKEPEKLQIGNWVKISAANVMPRWAEAFRELAIFVAVGFVLPLHCHAIWNQY
jgi:hypothetical protein